MLLGRRAWLGLASGGAIATCMRSPARAENARPPQAAAAANGAAAPGDLGEDLVGTEIDMKGATDKRFGDRFSLYLPRYLPQDMKLPLLVLFHGLGETGDVRTGIRAWRERYGLGTAFDRLRRPPLARTFKPRDDFGKRLGELNDELMRSPFYGFAIACPYTPKATTPKDLDDYAQFVREIIARARDSAAIVPGAAGVSIDGCSLGGFVGLEVFLRIADHVCAWGGVQSAISEPSAIRYADRLDSTLAQAPGRRRIHIVTSDADVFRAGNERLSAELKKRNIAHELMVLPGYHDQIWLRESGTLEMLLWQDRALHGN